MSNYLVEIGDGVWVSPETVKEISCCPGDKKGLFGQGFEKSKVKVKTENTMFTFEYPTIEDAIEAADWIASVVNGGGEPDDPEREDLPDEGNVVPIRAVAS